MKRHWLGTLAGILFAGLVVVELLSREHTLLFLPAPVPSATHPIPATATASSVQCWRVVLPVLARVSPLPTPPSPTATPAAMIPVNRTPLPKPTPTHVLQTPQPPVAAPTATAQPDSAAPPPAPTATAPSGSLRERLVARARYYASIKTRYSAGNTGPTSFDCTGLVYRVFADCGALDLIGTQGEQGVHNYYTWFEARKWADSDSPKPGDLIVYGPDFAHIGIYIGDGRAISTLSDGVREHDATRLKTSTNGKVMPVIAYLHVQAN